MSPFRPEVRRSDVLWQVAAVAVMTLVLVFALRPFRLTQLLCTGAGLVLGFVFGRLSKR